MERDIFKNELTAQAQRAYSNSRGINMSDGPGAGENPPVNSSGEGAPKAESSSSSFSSITTPQGRQGLREGKVFGRFFESREEKAAKDSGNRFYGQADNPDSARVIKDVIKLKGATPEERIDAIEELVRAEKMPKDEAEKRLKEVRKELSEEVATEVKAEMDSGDDKDENDDKEVKEEKKKPEFAKPETGRPREDQIKVFKPTDEFQPVPPGLEIPVGAEIRNNIEGKLEARWVNPPDIEIEYTERSDNSIKDSEDDKKEPGDSADESSDAEEESTNENIREELEGMGIKTPSKKHRKKEDPTPEDTVEHLSKIKSEDESGTESAKKTEDGTRNKKESKREDTRDTESEEGENKRFIKELLRHLSNEDVQRQLISDNPEFTSLKGHELGEGVDDFRHFIERIVPGGDLITFANIISRKQIKIDDETINLSDASRMLLFEWAMNRIITIPNADEDSPYDLSLELTNYRDRLKAMAQSNFSGEKYKDFHARISGIASVEQVFHNVRIAIASGSERYQELFQSLRTPSLNFINNNLVGVSQVMNEFERSFLLEASQSATALNTTQTNRARERAIKTIENAYKKGSLRDGERVINRWEMERALRLGEIFFRADQRGAVYTTAGDPTGMTDSFLDEQACRQIAPAMAWWRFWYPKAHGKPATRKLLDRTINNMERQWNEKVEKAIGDKSSLGQTQVEDIDSILGLSREDMFRNYLGVFDVASHTSVRGPKLYLSPIKMENGTEEGITMYDFLNGKSMKKIDSQAQLDEIETRVLGQTSYLSALNRHTSLSTELRTKIWRKRAVIDPVAVASLRPEIIRGEKDPKTGEFRNGLTPEQQEAWNMLLPVLDEYHIMKLNDEKIKYSREISNKEMEDEAAKFRGTEIDDGVKDEILNSEYFQEIINAVDEEGGPLYSEAQKKAMIAVFKTVVDRGIGQAEYLARTTASTRHNYAIDDAPIVAWYDESGQGLNDNNFVRQYGDQEKLAKLGFEPLTPIVDDPKLGIDGEAFDNAVKGFAQVIGDDPARELVEGMMRGFLQMANQYEKTKWLPTFSHERGKARSELEEYFGNLGVYWSETDKRQWLEGRAYKGTIENELQKPRGERRLNQIKGGEGAGRMRLAIETIREDFLKIGPIVVLSTFFVETFKLLREAIEGGVRENA